MHKPTTTPINLIDFRFTPACGACAWRSGAYYEESHCDKHDLDVQDYHVCNDYAPGQYIQSAEQALHEAARKAQRRAEWEAEQAKDEAEDRQR